MHAVTIERTKYFKVEDAQAAYDSYLENEEARPWSREYKRELHGNEIWTYIYDQVYPFQLDSMFEQQMNSVDNKLATGATKRTSKNGYDPGLTDYNGEEDDH